MSKEKVQEGVPHHIVGESRNFNGGPETDMLKAWISADGSTKTLDLGDPVLKTPIVNINGATALAGNPLVFKTFVGVAAAGPITFTGVKVGDLVAGVIDTTASPMVSGAALFEAKVSVAGQIQQLTATDESTHTFIALVVKQS
jgi:hypothetical protein